MTQLIKRRYTLKTFPPFLKVSGEDEADFVPNFERFFFDEEGYASKVLEPEIFFVLGRKGTGKSLLARYVTRRAMDSQFAFRRIIEVQSFRNFAFHKLTPFKQEFFRDKEYFAIWRWLLWLAIARELIKDEAIEQSVELDQLKVLINEHFWNASSPTEIIERTNTLIFKGGLGKFLSLEGRKEERERPGETTVDASLVEKLVITAFRSSSMEVVVF